MSFRPAPATVWRGLDQILRDQPRHRIGALIGKVGIIREIAIAVGNLSFGLDHRAPWVRARSLITWLAAESIAISTVSEARG